MFDAMHLNYKHSIYINNVRIIKSQSPLTVPLCKRDKNLCYKRP